jgi:HTH-type transcriptional regulator, transcriptional repressor of NAD biosynthesis genes
MKTRGLTLGKYAPFHKGHQHVVETMLAEMDEVIVLIYDCPEAIDVPLNKRADWIRQLYPSVRVIEAWDGPHEVGDTPEIKRAQENYILNKLKLNGITHFYSSEFYGEHMSIALNAVNRIVDPNRLTVPISGTAIRQNPFAFRHYLDPLVYRDLITNVVFLGAPSTGKTTLAARMANEFATVWMPEYGREYWEAHQVNRRLSLEQLVEIAEGHLAREQAMLYNANRYLFTDTNALTTYQFSMYYHQSALPRLVELANQATSRYDLVFVCDVDIPYDDTWDRSGDANRLAFQRQIISDLVLRKIPFIALRGDLETRQTQVKQALAKYPSIAIG